MNDPKSLEKVAEFHKIFKHPVKLKPEIPDKKRCDLRVSLLEEEIKELRNAVENNDIVEVADALCDIQYVLSGAVLEFGLADHFQALFDEVQRSNLSKACKSEEEAKETVNYYQNKGTDCYYEKAGDQYLVYRRDDNKTLKSVYYSPADLKKIIDQ